ncbi:dirigent protein 17-like isoform X1 [Rhododendron vialii]|uniref:dirigent protein 17-like isoform X1 n=1 Tax=Rhododendron vialii TaxID=182163 RepID=UPI00265F4D82|nr:dirigent protein 17-like isoform X1 [Rhododendron vialii]XP_058213077.1 dirigent protein 17-like isoform X1 [Rhododendron vialii]XP_058213078.1 dirigent protein 17-like isoform X1 [Rhododendron vialii]
MDITCKEEESETLPTSVFELPGEPAIVINGVPPLPPNYNALVPCDIVGEANSDRTTGFGEWLKGREVRKLFGEQFYKGNVTEFDKDASWYKVVYEDGDYEDLEWHELQEVLVPLDVTMPMKALALKIIKQRQKPSHKTGKMVTKSRNPQAIQTGFSS